MAYRITGKVFRLDHAEAAIDAVISSDYVIPRFEALARSGLGFLAAEMSDGDMAAEQYSALEPYRNTMTLFALSADRALGLVAHTMGNLNQAKDHFDDALAFCREAGYHPELAWTCCDYADTLLQRDEPGDRERAISLLEESRSISTELGMRPLMERVQNRVEGLESVVAAPHSHPDNLTRREVEVLQLITQGKSNRDIGQELVITESTVRRHVSNIYDKIGVSNRTEAARYALREGLALEN